jgi:membrane carboxypeptidase/penicillin-binding protein PbpC
MGHPNALEIGTSIAVKMGRTLDGRDAWTIGYTPEVVIGVWTGSDTEVKGDIGSELASDLWHALAQYTLRESPPTEWVMPPGISQVDVCGTSGFLPTPECPTTVREVFLAGTEPTQRDYLYQSVQVNRQTGRLASVFTPPEYLEERVFLSVPADAQVWADQAGLPSPPEEYDILNPGISTSEDAQITSPELFSYVRGKLEIRGSAGGDGFQFYRLQAGQGLNPQQWLLIDQERSSSVNDGVLGIWDTSGLKGLYALQLLVVGEGQRVESVVTQVTIDNEPPQLTIIQPQAGQVYSEGIEEIDIHLDVSDDLGLERVDFRIDEQLLEALSQPPYQFQWQAVPGKHTLSVEARDQAGNTSQTEIDFSVQ